uniref:Uncharacterized protein n=1 Tax=viral metagenome TaxID=1070528 RepID=A0A6H2A6C3_9ZZZZ
MNIFQKLYDWIKGLKTPQWYVDLMNNLQITLIRALEQIGKEALASIKDKIIEVAGQDISNEQKFKIVFNFTKSLLPTLKDSVINAIINLLVLTLKEKKII